ncbi:MAG: hypothetical protein MZW92_20465 [Comamonadaceae bacterium]|nr:hypothetical protein [Comamonadaceae bacterium]
MSGRGHREPLLVETRSRSTADDFEHGGDVAARIKAIMQQLGIDPDVDAPALDRQLRGRDERRHVRRGGRQLEFQVRPDAVRVIAGRPAGRASPTSSWRCRRAGPPPRPRCARGASAPGLGLPNIEAQQRRVRDRVDGRDRAPPLRYAVHLSTAPRASRRARRQRVGPRDHVIDPATCVGLRGLLARPARRSAIRVRDGLARIKLRAVHRLRRVRPGLPARRGLRADLDASVRPGALQAHGRHPVADALRPVRPRRRTRPSVLARPDAARLRRRLRHLLDVRDGRPARRTPT